MQETQAGNLVAPKLEDQCKWILEAWDSISTETITNSFPICGINLPQDGSLDDKIKCFRNGEKCEEGRAELFQKLAAIRLEPDAKDTVLNAQRLETEAEEDSDAELLLDQQEGEEAAQEDTSEDESD